jgi:hypothetical protein
MADTVEQIWRRVLLHCPQATAFLAKNWVQTTYNRLCGRKPWSFLRAESQFLINASRSGTVDVVYTNATVTGGTLVFASTDIGRQFRVSFGPPYTIIAVNTVLNTATLDEPWGNVTATATTGKIFDAYVTLPYDFGAFIAVLDTQNAWQLHIDRTQDELNFWDTQRSATGTPWALVSRRLSTGIAAQLGRVQYELWPYCMSQKRLPYFYYKAPQTLLDTDYLQGSFRDRTDLILTGALIEAAKWPGPSAEKKNPYFNLQTAQMLAADFEQQANALETRDEEIYITWLETVNFARLPFAPVDSNFMRNHDYPTAGAFGVW